MTVGAVPDIGANMTAILPSMVSGIILQKTNMVLHIAARGTSKVLGAFDTYIGLGNTCIDGLYRSSRIYLTRSSVKQC